MRNSRRQTTLCTWMNFDKKAAAITLLHLEMVSGVGELPTSWLPHTQTMGMAGLRLLYTFFRSASCLARISGCFSAKASTRSPQTTKKAGLGCKLLRMSTLCLHSSTFGNMHLNSSQVVWLTTAPNYLRVPLWFRVRRSVRSVRSKIVHQAQLRVSCLSTINWELFVCCSTAQFGTWMK